MSNKIGRNDPCPCGSGKKAKKCCWDDINRIVGVDKRILKIGEQELDELMDDLETDRYGEEYIKERTTIKHG